MTIKKYIEYTVYHLFRINFSFMYSKPIPPRQSECCGCGCYNCVWIDYRDRMNKYNLDYIK